MQTITVDCDFINMATKMFLGEKLRSDMWYFIRTRRPGCTYVSFDKFLRNEKFLERFLTIAVNTAIKNGGLVYGSSVYMLPNIGFAAKYHTRPGDLDIIFKNIDDQEKFADEFGEQAELIKNELDEKLKQYVATQLQERADITVKVSAKPISYYAFTSDLMYGKNTNETILGRFNIELHKAGRFMLRTHLLSIDTQCINTTENLTQEQFIEFVLNKITIVGPTKAVYDGRVHYKQDAITDVSFDLSKYPESHKAIKRFIGKVGYKKSVQMMPTTNRAKYARPADLLVWKDIYNNAGIQTVPLSREDNAGAGKAPAYSGWLKPSYDDKNLPDYVFKNASNIGILCGPKSGLVCIDVDQKDDGVKVFNALMKHFGIPNCPRQVTPNNGYHYIFKYDPIKMANMNAKIKGVEVDGKKIGIDFWIKDVQFVAHPSINYANGKQYVWAIPLPKKLQDLPEMPDWIYQLYENGTVPDEVKTVLNAPEEINPEPVSFITAALQWFGLA
jgi:Bifunctional DNA primase/polymerase, N-terminal